MRRWIATIGAVGAALAFGVLVGYMSGSDVSRQFEFLFSGQRLSDCIADDGRKLSLLNYANARLEYCYRRVHWQATLDDFNIRRMIYQGQMVANVVLLWMVVVITLSGVLLSALQLYTSYRMSMAGKIVDGQGSFEIEKGRLILRSSVVGLFIMLFSFAFFYVYVIFVYKITEHPKDGSAGIVMSQSVGFGKRIDQPGQMGPPNAGALTEKPVDPN